ncbi:SEC14-like protein 2 like protein [Argiope bruennichi]|uniref:SEC14-like protein 2 like protein n=1 Tax=Argiope bruennichi TaxID=94029 RepID=A0A8T0FVX0_ARGBR|nr:SEC14-like protein 2 like protein [Argiope bruennichi]
MKFPEDISPAQVAAVKELKNRTINDVTPKMLEDNYLFYRFLKAREFDLQKAEDMLRKNIAWRKRYNVDTILTDYTPPEVLEKYYPVSFIGYDKNGFPVRYIDFATDQKGIYNSVKKSDLVKFSIYKLEQDSELLKAQSQKLGKPITKVSYIYNFEGMTISKATDKTSIELLLLGARIFQDNYPERLKEIYVINAAAYFSIMFSVVKTLAPQLFNKIYILGAEKWREELIEVIDADALPAFLGGNKTDSDGNPLCKTFIIHGTTIPESYYLKKSEKNLLHSPEAKKLTVTRLSKENLTFEVEEGNSLLEWEFETKNKDIAFGVYFKENSHNESKPVELLPKRRIDTYYEPETGIFKCEQPGTYIVVFDNSYSWLFEKEVYYKIKIVHPNENNTLEAIDLQE